MGLKQLKDLGIYHRDIKPGNFLYDLDNRRGLLIDFGLAEIDLAYKDKLEENLKRMEIERNPNYEKEFNRLKIYKKLV